MLKLTLITLDNKKGSEGAWIDEGVKDK